MQENFNIYTETDGTTLTGSFPLSCEWWEGTVTELKIEKSSELSISAIELSGAICDVLIDVSYDNKTAWAVLASFTLETKKHLHIAKDDLIEVSPHENDKVWIRARWSQGTAAKTYLNLATLIRA